MQPYLDLTDADHALWLADHQLPLYRQKQILEGVFQKRAHTFEAISNLPAPIRKQLDKDFCLRQTRVILKEKSQLDGTVRYTFEASDGERFTAVALPAKERLALCLSTQVGCAYACQFCATGLMKLQRNLLASEILDQIFWIEEDRKQKATSILFMGMGEPLANYNAVVHAVRWITSPDGLGMSPHRIVLSTSGVVPGIERLTRDRVKVDLAISLHATTDALRVQLLPVSGHFPIRGLLKAVQEYSSAMDVPVTFEFILLRDVNDSPAEARRLVKLAHLTHAKVNLIAYNPVKGLPYQTPTEEAVENFQKILRDAKVPVFLRRPRGRDIDAGCGQLGEATLS